MPDACQGVSPNSRLLNGDLTRGSRIKARPARALSASMATHVTIFVIAITIAHMPKAVRLPVDTASSPPPDITWLVEAGGGLRGGGGGNDMAQPPRRAELPGEEKITVPAAKPPKLENTETPKDDPQPPAQIAIPALTVASGLQEVPGGLTGLWGISQGPGSRNGAGTGDGGGIGAEQGRGLGSGRGHGYRDVYGAGNGVVSPRLLVEVKPNYTSDAMRAKIQGVVALEAVVMPDGSVGTVRVTRSLDSTFGLDQEAIRTVKKWRFSPGMLLGQPVPVLVAIEIAFTLH